jgi:hypothetical protein
MPKVPVTVSVKKRATNSAASANRMRRSVEPMFAFIVLIDLFAQTCRRSWKYAVTFVTGV